MIALGVNIDHVATLRQARRARYPDPLYAALLAEELMFGQVFRLFFARHIAQPLPVKAEQKR